MEFSHTLFSPCGHLHAEWLRSRMVRDVSPTHTYGVIAPSRTLTFHWPGQEKSAGAKSLDLLLSLFGPTKEAAEKGDFEKSSSPQRLKPDSLHSSYVRPEGRTLQTERVFPQPLTPVII